MYPDTDSYLGLEYIETIRLTIIYSFIFFFSYLQVQQLYKSAVLTSFTQSLQYSFNWL